VTQRRALVTGGASGIGAACATRLTADGIDVVTTDLAAGADERVDVSDPDSVAALRDRVGAVDVLVNSAGIIGPSAPLVDLDLNAWRRTFAVNTDGTFLMCRAFAPAMVERGWGRIVNVASIAAKDGNPTQSAYSAVIALTKSLGKELATTGVLVNVVAPAAVATPMNAATDPAVLARSQSLTPMGRFGTAEEIAELIAWLSSNAVSFSTGAVYDASGGRATY
jgi:NAD(P)-dependent dehydrogenase (short-subunit alcohol dehydrogenase family)